MADSFTPNLDLDLIEVGGSDDTWGDKINANTTALDDKYGTGSGTHVLRDVDSELNLPGLKLSGAAATLRRFRLYTTTALRWAFGANSTAEGGSNAGSDFQLARYADDGTTLLGTSLSIERKTGIVTLEAVPMVNSDTVLTTGNSSALNTPIGVLFPFAGTTAPTKFLFANGQELLVATYPDLHTAIGNTYGARVPGTTFNVPDLCGRAPVGKDDMGGITAAGRLTSGGSGLDGTVLGGAGGEQTHTLLIAEIPSHDHGGVTGSTTPSSTVPISTAHGQDASGSTSSGGWSGTTAGNLAHTHTISAQGGGGAHNNVQPSLVLNYIIRALP